jgi:dipeptidyl aminopeptidase/acylaminoacyl peptidase
VRLIATVAAALVLAAPCRGDESHGRWTGTVVYRGASTTAILDIRPDAGDTAVRVSLPGLSVFDVPAHRRTAAAGRLELDIEHPVHLRFAGRFDGSNLTGAVTTSSGATAVVRLNRSGSAPGLQVREEHVRIVSGGRILGGTLIVPTAAGLHPAVVMLHGSHGPDREDLRAPAMLFSRAGLAVLIYDKRDLGNDQGRPHRYGFEELASDGLAAVRFLRSRPEIDARRVGLWGISEGGWIAPMIAAADSGISFLIAVSAPGVTYAELLEHFLQTRMRRQGATAADRTDALATLRGLFAYVRGQGDAGFVERSTALVARGRWAADFGVALRLPTRDEIGSEVQWRDLDVDPSAYWRRVRVPVLAVWGERDEHPVSESVSRIRSALERAGNRDVTLLVFPRADHELVVSELSNTWRWPRLASGFVQLLLDWAARRAGTPLPH